MPSPAQHQTVPSVQRHPVLRAAPDRAADMVAGGDDGAADAFLAAMADGVAPQASVRSVVERFGMPHPEHGVAPWSEIGMNIHASAASCRRRMEHPCDAAAAIALFRIASATGAKDPSTPEETAALVRWLDRADPYQATAACLAHLPACVVGRDRHAACGPWRRHWADRLIADGTLDDGRRVVADALRAERVSGGGMAGLVDRVASASASGAWLHTPELAAALEAAGRTDEAATSWHAVLRGMRSDGGWDPRGLPMTPAAAHGLLLAAGDDFGMEPMPPADLLSMTAALLDRAHLLPPTMDRMAGGTDGIHFHHHRVMAHGDAATKREHLGMHVAAVRRMAAGGGPRPTGPASWIAMAQIHAVAATVDLDGTAWTEPGSPPDDQVMRRSLATTHDLIAGAIGERDDPVAAAWFPLLAATAAPSDMLPSGRVARRLSVAAMRAIITANPDLCLVHIEQSCKPTGLAAVARLGMRFDDHGERILSKDDTASYGASRNRRGIADVLCSTDPSHRRAFLRRWADSGLTTGDLAAAVASHPDVVRLLAAIGTAP